MSLFGDSRFRWRETYFVLFDEKNRPTADALAEALRELGDRFEITEIRSAGEGRFESLTLHSPYDFAAMDITYLSGEDVLEQIQELQSEMKDTVLTKDERAKLDRLRSFNARFDIYHFERMVDNEEDEEEEFLDPGALLVVLERLARLCHGVGVDPQAGTLI